MILLPAAFLTQNLKAWKSHLIQLVANAASAGGMFLILHFVNETSYANMYFLGAIFVLICFTVYILVPKEENQSYYANIFSHFLFSFFLVFIAFLGSMLICYAFSSLIYEIDDIEDLLLSMAAIFFQLCFTVVYTYHLLEKRKEPTTKLFKVIFLYIVLPVYLLLIGLLYAYLLKALFTFKFPQGQINWFVSFATAIYLVFYFILQEYRNEKTIGFFYRYGGLILIPLILVQFPAYFVRLNAYGFTGWRYTSLLYNIFATVCIIFTFIKKGKFVKYAIPILGFLGIIAAFTPLNLINVAYNSQYGRLVKVLQKYEMFDGEKLTDYDAKKIDKLITDDDREALYGSFSYIRNTSEHKEPEWLDKVHYISFKELFNIGNKGEINTKEARWQLKDNEIEIDVTGFNSIKRAGLNLYGYSYETPKARITLYGYGTNLKDYIFEHDTESKKPIIVDLTENTRMVIIGYSYCYDLEKENFTEYNVEYYVLKKD